jgi:hypothetical protein
MNVLVLIIPVLAACVFVALWALRSGSSRRKDRNGGGAVYPGGNEDLWVGGAGVAAFGGNEDSRDGVENAADFGGAEGSWDSGGDGGGGGGDGGGGGGGD